MHAFSQADFDRAIAELKAVLEFDPGHFDAQLALGMACCRKGDFAQAIVEGHKAEQLRPKEQLVHTNLSLFYMKSGDRVAAERHGLQARIASWRETPESGPAAGDSELEFAQPKPQNQLFRSPPKFPQRPWKKPGGTGGTLPPAAV